MSHRLNSLKGVSFRGLYRGVLKGILRENLGVQTIAHMCTPKKGVQPAWRLTGLSSLMLLGCYPTSGGLTCRSSVMGILIGAIVYKVP